MQNRSGIVALVYIHSTSVRLSFGNSIEEAEMKIEVLGMGCVNCNKLYQNVVEAVRLSGKEVEVNKVEDLKVIMRYGVLSVPALVIDGLVKTAGKVPKAEEIKEWIK